MTLVFATQNQNKALEIQAMMPAGSLVKTLKDLNCDDDIAETGSTLEENALIKARFVFQKFKLDCFADDTGLEIEALNGKPGVLSARYAGEAKNAQANMDLVLDELRNQKNRRARFRTVIALILDGKEFLFEGIVNGTITTERSGTDGFGYDPIFKPDDSNLTFAQMNLAEKNTRSHRGKALTALISFLNMKA